MSLLEAVRAVLGAPEAELGEHEAVPSHVPQVSFLSGTARVGGEVRAWRLVEKTPRDNREARAYASGVLDALPGPLRAARCHGVEDLPDGSTRIWLEHVERDDVWGIERWALTARHLGLMNAGVPTPSASWLDDGVLRRWVERHDPLIPRITTAPDDPGVAQWWPRSVVDEVLRLWAEREKFLGALERLPRRFAHGDAIRRNLFARGAETVAIDWEHVGLMALGEEVGQTLSTAAAFYDWQPARLPELDEALFESYVAGLRAADWRGDMRQVRFAYCAHAALRNGFNAVGSWLVDAERDADARRRFGYSVAELAERRAAIRPFLLGLADEARALMAGG